MTTAALARPQRWQDRAISNQYEAMLPATAGRDEQERGHVIACTLTHMLR